MRVKRYQSENSKLWNEFAQAYSDFFFFQRDFMEYHQDRFEDHSLLIYKEDELVAILPASVKSSVLICHGGLTFGFLVCSETRYLAYKDIWQAVQFYCKEHGLQEVIYKKSPQFFNVIGQDNDSYELIRKGAKPLKTELTSYINFTDYIYSKGRKSSVQKSLKQGLTYHHDSDQFAAYFEVLTGVLSAGHGVKPTHSIEELVLLKQKFSQNIILSIVKKDGRIVAGAILFIFGKVVHTQYLAVTEVGKNLCAMDFLMNAVIEHYKATCTGLSFGISTEQGGQIVNEGLVLQKESYGAKNYLINTYQIKWS